MTVPVHFLTCVLCLWIGPLAAQNIAPPPESTSARREAQSAARSAGPRNSLDDFSQAVQRLISDVSPAVVDVVVQSFGRLADESSGKANTVSHQTREATGVLVSADGYLITNAHVVLTAQRVQIRFGETAGSTQGDTSRRGPIQAEVVGIDQETDLAVLKVPGTNWKYLPFADSSRLRQGEVVFAVGNPRGLENSVSMGIVSAVERQLDPDASQAFIQTDAPINPGNSGGPLVNTRGEIAGINTFIFTSSGGNEGLGFAIPSSFVRDIYGQLKRYGRVRRGELGVVVRSVTPTIARALGLPQASGVLIQDVMPGKAAADAGVQINDIVVRVEGRSVMNLRQFSNSLFRSEIGEKLKLEVLREDTRVELQVALQEPNHEDETLLEQVKERAVPIPRIGILVVPLDSETAALVNEPRHDFGTIVAAKLQTSFILQEELEPGDVIFGINGQPASNIDALTGLVNGLTDGSPIVVQVQRQGVLRYLVLSGD
jgi:serine protease Do